MDKTEELIKKYTLTPAEEKRLEILQLYNEEISIENIDDHEYLKTLCILLFSIGDVRDSLLVWKAKSKDFDAGAYIDIQLLCGAGLQQTKSFLEDENTIDSKKALEYLVKTETTGDFEDFDKEKVINFYKNYYRV